MNNANYYQRNKEIILRLREQARDKYRNLSEEDKKKKRENMGKICIIICLKKEAQIKRIPKKKYQKAKK